MEFFNSLNLTQIKGGTKLKQGDLGSVLSYSLTDENGQEITSFDTKTAYINLVLGDKIWFTTTTLVDISRVTFRIDKAIPTGLYYLEIKIDDYIFPSDRDSIILIEEGSTPYDLKELVPNYDINMTINGILSDLSQKGIDITNLKSKIDKVQLETTAQLAQKANKDEVTNVMTPKGTLAYASLPTSGNQVGWYYYCPDGDGTHGAGNYVWNGTSWFFGGTGDEGYNLLKDDIVNISEYAQSNTFYNDYTDNNVTEAYRGEYGYYRYTDGKLIKEQFNATIKIPVSYGDTFIITGTYGYASCLIAEYNRNGNFIQPILYNTDKNITVTNYEYTVPVGVKYIGISSISNTFKIVQRKYISVKDKLNDTLSTSSNILNGKKWVACGDSYTHGDFTGYVDSNGKSGIESDAYDKTMNMYKTYPWWIAKRNNMTLVNEAINGSTMAYPKSGNPTDTNAFSYERYKNIDADADYITLWFGINDSSNCNLGKKGDGGVNTFYGAFSTVLYYLVTRHPKAKIGVIITNRSTYEFRQATREVCNSYGIPYLDMMGDTKVPMIFGREESTGIDTNIIGTRNAQFVVSSTNSHPNLYAHEYQSTFIENWLRSL